MTKIRGFKLGKRLHRVTRFFFLRKPTTTRPGYRHLIQTSSSSPQSNNYKPISKLLTWTRQLTSGAKSLCCSSRRRPGSGYMQLGDEEELPKPVTSAVPKGQLAVYVGQKDGDCRRVLVPVIYFNHPLFGELLKEAEMEFGFKHPGGITIPCPISDFENVKTRIENGSGQRRLARWKSS